MASWIRFQEIKFSLRRLDEIMSAEAYRIPFTQGEQTIRNIARQLADFKLPPTSGLRRQSIWSINAFSPSAGCEHRPPNGGDAPLMPFFDLGLE